MYCIWTFKQPFCSYCPVRHTIMLLNYNSGIEIEKLYSCCTLLLSCYWLIYYIGWQKLPCCAVYMYSELQKHVLRITETCTNCAVNGWIEREREYCMNDLMIDSMYEYVLNILGPPALLTRGVPHTYRVLCINN